MFKDVRDTGAIRWRSAECNTENFVIVVRREDRDDLSGSLLVLIQDSLQAVLWDVKLLYDVIRRMGIAMLSFKCEIFGFQNR